MLHEIKARTVSCGEVHTLIIDLNNNIWAFGQNIYGQLGLVNNQYSTIPTMLPEMKAKVAACGETHTIIIDLNDNVWVFGSNMFGELGLGDTQKRNVPTLLSNIKAKDVACGGNYTIVMLSLNPQFGNNFRLINFNEVTRKLAAGDFLRFDFQPQYQIIPHNLNNSIGSFYGTDGIIYLAMVQYDQATNQINPPI